MAYQQVWEPHNPERSRQKAEERAMCIGQVQDLGFLYRLMEQNYTYCIDPDGDTWGSQMQVEIQAFQVRNWTKCGAQIYVNGFSETRFVNLEATKQFACKTVEEAVESFVARKTKQARIYRARADKADLAISLAKGEPFNPWRPAAPN